MLDTCQEQDVRLFLINLRTGRYDAPHYISVVKGMVPDSDNRTSRANSLAKIAKGWEQGDIAGKVLDLFLG